MKYTTYHLNWLLEKISQEKETDYLFFWGHQENEQGKITASCLSQWWPSKFNVEGVEYYTAEHWMMAQKAQLFGDKKMKEKILQAETPLEAKNRGRKVRNFDPQVWENNRFEIVCKGNFHKFQQHEKLRAFLLSTEQRVLVEASPLDTIWGIGLSKNNERATDPKQWRGLNLLGFALMEVRDQLMQT